MTLNEILRQVGSFILALLGGILSGLISTSIFHKRTRKIERTKIVISPEIARSYVDTENGDNIVEYRTKISNETPQDAYDVRGFVRIRYKQKYLTIKFKSTPVLHGNNGVYKEFDYQRVFPFRLSGFNPDTIEGTKDANIIEQYKNHKLELHHFKDKDTLMEIVIMSVDSLSGGVLDGQIKTFTYDELETSVITGEYEGKTLLVERPKECKSSEEI